MGRSNNIGKSDGSEEVIELMSHEAILNNQMVHESESFIIAEEVTSVLIDTAATNTIPNGTDDATNHDSNALPEIARNLSWDDPFYESSNDRNDIIMAFNLDRQKYDQFLLPRVLGIVGIVIFFTYIFTNGSDGWYVIFVAMIASYVIMFSLIFDGAQRFKQFRVKRAHIALTRNGIYFDEVDRPGGHNLMMRKLITYKEIRKCEVKREEGSCNAANYRVEVQLKARFSLNVVIEDILRPQQFVDIVNAFVAQYTDSATEEENPNNCTIS